MGKRVVLKFGKGSFEHGFPVTVQIGKEGQPFSAEIPCEISPALNIPQQYENWRSAYHKLGFDFRIKAVEGLVTNISVIDDCNQAAQTLYDGLITWLSSASFFPIKEIFLKNVHHTDEVRILLQTENTVLQNLPWHNWDLIDNYPNAEIALSPREYQKVVSLSRDKFRILAIFGCNEGINIDKDRELLSKLPNAELTFLVKQSLQQIHDRLWQEKWDIIFFAGHSNSEPNGQSGRIYINDTESLTLDELSNGLRNAIKNGLKLAIFNSCDGMGLARSLFKLNIPQVIVMRERVPDLVAQEFLRYFLIDFAAGTSLYQSVRRARERLQGLQNRFPCATWLPIICQNPAETPLIWPSKWKKYVRVLCIVLLILLPGGIGLWWLNTQCKLPFQVCPKIDISGSSTGTQTNIENANHFSLGDRILVTANTNSEKQSGVEAFAKGDYKTAIIALQAALRKTQNDPEALIYLNNAKAAITNRTLRIAVSVPIGSNLNIAQEILRGVAQIQEEVNSRGGINGALIEVEIANDNNKPEAAKQVAAGLVKDSKVLGVVGHNASEASIAAAPIYQAGRLVMISPTSSVLELSNTGNYIFRTAPSNRVDAQKIAHYAIQNAGKKRFAICIDSKSSFSTSIKTELNNAVIDSGGHLSTIPCDLSDPNFNPSKFIPDAISDRVDALVLIPSVDKIAGAIDLVKANKRRISLFGGSTMYTFDALQKGQADMLGMVLAVVWHPLAQPENPFAKSAERLWGGPVNWRTATSYDAAQAIIAGLRQDSSRDGVQKAISNPNFKVVDGATGEFEFLPTGDRKRSPQNDILIQVQVFPNNPTGYGFVPINP